MFFEQQVIAYVCEMITDDFPKYMGLLTKGSHLSSQNALLLFNKRTKLVANN